MTVLDYNGDGWPDLFVANDTQPNKLYRNNKNGTFTEEGMAAGVAFGEDGVARGAMGADAADYDRSGRPHLLVGNFSNQMLGLYHNEGNGLFVDEAPSLDRGPRQPAVADLRRLLLRLRPGRLPRHLRRQRPHRGRDRPRAAQGAATRKPPLLFRNLGKRKFENVERRDGRGLQPADGGARRGLRRFRPRRRPRRPDLHQQRPGLPVPQRRRQPQPLAVACGWRARSRIATASAPWCASRARRASSGTRCAADRATARRAIWR